MTRLLLLGLLAIASVNAADDPYGPWQNGRPGESATLLQARAQVDDRWDCWLDAGLAAAAADERGQAVALLLEAHRRAPAQPDPRQALAALDSPLPPGWCDRLGIAVVPGSSRWAPLLALMAGTGFGWSLIGRRGRCPALVIAVCAAALVIPGATAAWHDGHRPLVVATNDTQLVDSLGQPQAAVPAGTICWREPHPPWNGRLAVRLQGGTTGFIPEIDLILH